MSGRDSSNTVRTEEKRDTGSANDRIGVQAERTDSGEEMEVIADAMGIHPTPHTPSTDRDMDRTETEVGWCDR